MEKLQEAYDDLIKRYPKMGGIFQVGEEVEFKGSKFRISKIIQNGLKLELLPK
jgi:hypothetical protein